MALLCAGGLTGCTRPPGPLVVDDRSNGRAVAMRTEQLLIVRLDHTTWRFLPPSGSGVLSQGPEVVSNGPLNCRVFADCGSVEVVVRAAQPGHAVIRAIREKCGELVFCNARAGTFRLRVRVRP
jgi:hypothetical protein